MKRKFFLIKKFYNFSSSESYLIKYSELLKKKNFYKLRLKKKYPI